MTILLLTHDDNVSTCKCPALWGRRATHLPHRLSLRASDSASLRHNLPKHPREFAGWPSRQQGLEASPLAAPAKAARKVDVQHVRFNWFPLGQALPLGTSTCWDQTEILKQALTSMVPLPWFQKQFSLRFLSPCWLARTPRQSACPTACWTQA